MAAEFGRRLRRGATTTAVAAAAVAALSASQAPGVTHTTLGGGEGSPGQGAADTDPGNDSPVTGNSPYYTDLPPLVTPDKPGTSVDLPAEEQGSTTPTEAGIPATVLAAYKNAEKTISASDPGCHVPWQLLAAIGKVESGQARGGQVDAQGTTRTPILGPVLNGVGFANISDTDNGAYDGDTTYDRAVGPMQFIPSTWATWGQDANADGRKDPNNIHDAALAAGRYLCAGDRDLRDQVDLDEAILGYNQSRVYLRTVLSWFEYYKKGTHSVPDGTGPLPGAGAPDSPGSGFSGGSTPKPKPPKKPPVDTDLPKPGDKDKPGNRPPAKPPTPPKPKPPTKPPVSPVSRIENVGAATVTAMAGREFTTKVAVRVENAQGRGVAEQAVRFQIVGATDTRFPGGRTSAVLTTAADGRVVAPVLTAGEKTGSFIVRATVVGHPAPGVEVAAKVTPRAADLLEWVGDTPLTAPVDSEFTEPVEIRATHRGTVASGVAVTVSLFTAGPDVVPAVTGPYFKDVDGKPLRTLALVTDAKGALVLPKIYTDGEIGTFDLRITATTGGGTVSVPLTVTEEITTIPVLPTLPG
ncbi:lytic transglycosylase domain-containing protein, partial [Streptomyces clavuligerus]